METTQLQIINLTPHVTVFDGDTVVLSIESAGVARVASFTEQVGQIQIGEVVVTRTHTTFGEVEGLPSTWSRVYCIKHDYFGSCTARYSPR